VWGFLKKMYMNKSLLTAVVALTLVGCVGGSKSYPELSIPQTNSAEEPDSGDIKLKIPLELKDASDGSVFNISVSISHISTNDSDVQLLSGSTMEVSGLGENAIEILVRSDSFVEPDESFNVTLSSDDVSIINHSSMVTIKDKTPATTVSFLSDSNTIAEGTGSQSVNIVVSNPPEEGDITLTFSFDGTATRGENGVAGDYIVESTQLVIPAGVTSATLPITVVEDGLSEGGESIAITMSAPGFTVSKDTTVVHIPGDLAINDTGTILFYNGTGFQATESADYPSQDADHGLDVDATDTDGKAGFRLTRLDDAGNAVSAGNPYRCVKDENTGLIWEVKTSPTVIPAGDPTKSYAGFVEEEVRLSNLETDDPDYKPYAYNNVHAAWQSANYAYYWFNENADINGGSAGASGPAGYDGYMMQQTCAFPNQNQVGYSSSTNRCNTDLYAKYASALAVCGVKDWRMPTIEELRSILNYNPTDDGLDPNYFPFMNGYRYLSSTPYSQERGSLWCMDTATKEIKLCNKQGPSSIMLVRGSE
jgi:hypothetical protein